MKIIHKQGWFKVRPSGLKLEVTFFDGFNTFCENLPTREYQIAADYCREKISNKS